MHLNLQDIHVPNPSGGGAVQIGCPADLSGIQARMTGFILLDEALRRTGFVIPSVTFCATAGFWLVDITFGSGLQIPTRARIS